MSESGAWKARLGADPSEWLLEKKNPSVRCLALQDLCGLPETHPDVETARAEIMNEGMVPRILDRRHAGGYWEEKDNFYLAKYRGTTWQFIILAEMGAEGTDPRIRETCEFILKRSQDRESGGFSYRGSERNGGHHSGVFPCLTGNMTWGLIRFGYLDDPRVQRAIDWITTYQRFDDGDGRPPREWPYQRFPQCWGRHTCHMGAVKAIKALGEIPTEQRTAAINDCLESGIEYLLRHHLHLRSHDLTRVAKPRWLRFGFPWLYQTDVLEMAWLLTHMGIRDERLREAIRVIRSKATEQGRWLQEISYRGRLAFNIEPKGKPSKWITLFALRVLKRAFRDMGPDSAPAGAAP